MWTVLILAMVGAIVAVALCVGIWGLVTLHRGSDLDIEE